MTSDEYAIEHRRLKAIRDENREAWQRYRDANRDLVWLEMEHKHPFGPSWYESLGISKETAKASMGDADSFLEPRPVIAVEMSWSTILRAYLDKITEASNRIAEQNCIPKHCYMNSLDLLALRTALKKCYPAGPITRQGQPPEPNVEVGYRALEVNTPSGPVECLIDRNMPRFSLAVTTGDPIRPEWQLMRVPLEEATIR
jgi:hypothetical protein